MVNLRIYVHDLKKTIGHSRALIEIINHFPANEIDSISVVSFSNDPLEELFPHISEKIKITKVPTKNIRPALLKIIFYQIYCLFDIFINVKEKTQTISIGLANPLASIIYVQFIHSQWKKRYLKELKSSGFKKLYKKIHYNFLCLEERFFYQSHKKQYICVAKFISNFMQEKFNTPNENLNLIYSGANLNEFSMKEDSLVEAQQRLQTNYNIGPKLMTSSKPIFLFVGAFERKGLPEAIEWLSPVKDKIEFIVVGAPEANSSLLKLPKWITHIPETKNIKHFYALADRFIFPTKYEPFGLVLLEAYAMGCDVLTNHMEVGASELISDKSGVHFFDQSTLKAEEFLEKLSLNNKIDISRERVKELEDKVWSKRALEFKEVIKKDFDNKLLSYLS